ncbi:hypothetical protein A2G96_23185 [Cupriavidus nantongensis]|uniref:Uncharacterized protein n=1 Tax=Cupriavidus nantongensis TaxID=1796606 RepID=A0A142JRN1_9BURK|nr:hypothetical protein A2G96_23185 [Cupriavidus nantongensis]
MKDGEGARRGPGNRIAGSGYAMREYRYRRGHHDIDQHRMEGGNLRRGMVGRLRAELAVLLA